MTYFEYHLIFNLPVVLLLLWLGRRLLRKAHLVSIAIIAVIAFAATTPWDNYAVHKGIWGFDWSRTTPIEVEFGGTKWQLPLEEYAFFVLETLVVGLLLVLFLPRPGARCSKT